MCKVYVSTIEIKTKLVLIFAGLPLICNVGNNLSNVSSNITTLFTKGLFISMFHEIKLPFTRASVKLFAYGSGFHVSLDFEETAYDGYLSIIYIIM